MHTICTLRLRMCSFMAVVFVESELVCFGPEEHLGIVERLYITMRRLAVWCSVLQL